MKLLAFALTALISVASFANTTLPGEVVARYQFGQSTSPFGPEYKLYNVELRSSRLLEIEITNGSDFLADVEPTRKVVRLSDAAYELLKGDIEALRLAEIVEHYQSVVCLVVVSPAEATNDLFVRTDDGLKLVDGPRGCWVHHQVYPESKQAQFIANQLKRSLRLLAL